MSTAEQPAHDATPAGPLPWWLGRGVGLALVACVVGIGWTFSWGVAAQFEQLSRPGAAAPDLEADLFAPVAARPGPASDEPPGDPSSPAPSLESSAPTDGAEGRQTRTSPSTDFALQAQALAERKRQRIEQARRADQQLSQFIEAVGVLDPLGAWVMPINAEYRITASFGQAGSMWSSDHTGVDLAAPSGTPVASVAAGTVTHAGEAGAYGLQVKVTHPDGTETSYSHLSRIDVTEGQALQQGAVIGAVGSTGNSTGPHLHLELRPAGGGPVDPVHALLALGVSL